MKIIKKIYKKTRYLFFLLLCEIRHLHLRLLGVNISSSAKIYGKIHVMAEPRNLVIGKNVTINEGVIFNCRDKIIIGDNCRISPYAQLHTGYLNVEFEKGKTRTHGSGSIVIGKNVWIASGVVIGANVKIGDNTIVSANSFVRGKLEANSLYGGVPAKKIKEILSK